MKIELNGRRRSSPARPAASGQAIAQGLAEAGAGVVLHGRDAGKLARAAQRSPRACPARVWAPCRPT